MSLYFSPFCRLYQHYELADENSSVSFEHIKKGQGTLDNRSFGKLVRHCFPGVVAKQYRLQHDWAKKGNRYVGIKQKITGFETIDIKNIQKMLPSDVFVKKLDTDYVTICYETDKICQSQPVTVSATITKDGHITMNVGSILIDSTENFVADKIVISDSSINALCKIMKSMYICSGFPVTEICGKMDQSIELWKIDGKVGKMYRSQRCRGMFNPLKSTCSSCHSLKKKLRCEAKENIPTGLSPLKKKQKHARRSRSDPDAITSPQGPPVISPTPSAPSVKSPVGKSPFVSQTETDLSAFLSQGTFTTNPIQKQKQNINHTQKALIKAQIQKPMQWDDSMIKHGLNIWTRHPKLYQDMRRVINLPSESVLRRKKNAVPQQPGINQENFDWLMQEASAQNININDLIGGLVFDEMSIQPNLVKGKGDTLIGYVNIGQEHTYMHELQHGQPDKRLANHVLQFIFNSLTCFRWPLAHYPTCGATAPELSDVIWDVIRPLVNRGISVLYMCFDGAVANRNLLHMLCPTIDRNGPLPYTMVNVLNPSKKIALLADPKHLIKKIRNSILNSGAHEKSTRRIIFQGQFIEWSQFMKIYEWDKNTHSFPIHYELTEQHLILNSADKMRNKLAEDVLNEDFLALTEQYEKYTYSSVSGTPLHGLKSLLQQTSKIVKLFSDNRPIYDMGDPRIKMVRDVADWFHNWEEEVMNMSQLSQKEKNRSLISKETREDIQCCLLGFVSLCTLATERQKQIIPGTINSDIIENTFCQQRASYHGANTHPDYATYAHSMNAIIFGERVVSSKSNSGGQGASLFAKSSFKSR